ncbi:GNAT family N-acetyltransferase [Oceanicola sp. 502str15]|uniref:GNAT family N-acetyltransferase n=1 Tax=Oceanicola sp. 502str15 TaxID=2696061 RepID=UPI0020964E8F|nr:GNAT family N-acetyltransferase [Oceanicola sp. 502str15]MCO6385102.1 GNAT family N-acetyltransferase [Oceanicola sp. 502str15]
MSTIPTLETDRLVLRAPEQADFETFAAFYASPRAQYVGGPLDRAAAWRMLAMEVGQWRLRGFGRWIVDIKDGATTAGLVGLFGPEGWPEPEIGWDLFEGHEGKGYATEAALAARAYAYDVLGWQTAISLVHPDNTGSARVCARLGAAYDSDFAHPKFGTIHIWRHPAPADLAAAGMEASA